MGKPDTPNAYSYYESKQFTRDTLPLDKAREIAAIFAEFGGDPREVLALAGLAGNDAEAEIKAIEDDRPQIITINMPVMLPSAARLRTMMESVLDTAGLGHLVDEYAERLAQLLPTALAGASVPGGLPSEVSATPAASHLPDPAKVDPGTRQ
jgi:hypothetical protein